MQWQVVKANQALALSERVSVLARDSWVFDFTEEEEAFYINASQVARLFNVKTLLLLLLVITAIRTLQRRKEKKRKTEKKGLRR